MRLHLAVALCAGVMSVTLSSATYAQQKTVKACEDEWRAKRAENQKAGITEKAYVEKCRAESAAATPPATAPAPATTKAAPAKEPAPAPAATKAPQAPAPTAKTTATGANQFPTEAAAKAHCPSDTVVWLNTSSKIFHFASSKDYGKTKAGAYMCEKDSLASGNRAAKNEKQP